MKQLHHNQQRLLNILQETIEAPLTMKELMMELEVSSTSVVHHHILQLEKKGFLKRNPGNPRDYQLLNGPENPVIYLNLYGQGQCGPNGSILDGNPEDRIPIASRLLKFPAAEAFLLKARGESMTPTIKPGDYVVGQKSSVASNGDLVIGILEGQTLIKSFRTQDSHILLGSFNPAFAPIITSADQFRIEGIVRNIWQYL